MRTGNCSYCGFTVNEDMELCSNCGKIIKESSYKFYEDEAVVKKRMQKNALKNQILLFLMFLIIVLGVGFFVLQTNEYHKKLIKREKQINKGRWISRCHDELSKWDYYVNSFIKENEIDHKIDFKYLVDNNKYLKEIPGCGKSKYIIKYRGEKVYVCCPEHSVLSTIDIRVDTGNDSLR